MKAPHIFTATAWRSLFLGLRRHTTTGLYVPELDGLRFVAIFCVYLYHVAGDVLRHTAPGMPHSASFLFKLTQQLNAGVPLFFSISGMVLGLPFARYWVQAGPKVSLKRYMLRRLTRLEPPYVLALLLFVVLKLLTQRAEAMQLLPHLAASLAYLHNLVYGAPSTINFVAWSLEVEVQFYLLAPVLALLFAIRKQQLRRLVLVMALIATSFLAHTLGPLAHLTLAGNIQYFVAGFLLAEIFLAAPPAAHRTLFWDAASLFGWPLLAVALVYLPGVVDMALPVFIVALYLGAFYGTLSSVVFANIWTAAMGGMCYTIYLLHNYVVAATGMMTERLAQQWPFELRLPVQVLLMSPIVLIVSVFYYRWIEQPCMRPDWPARLNQWLRTRMMEGAVPSPRKAEG